MNFFFNTFIHNEFFFLGYVLAWYFFLPPTFCMNFFFACGWGWKSRHSIITQIIKDLWKNLWTNILIFIYRMSFWLTFIIQYIYFNTECKSSEMVTPSRWWKESDRFNKVYYMFQQLFWHPWFKVDLKLCSSNNNTSRDLEFDENKCTKIGNHRCYKCKEKAIWGGHIIVLWIPL